MPLWCSPCKIDSVFNVLLFQTQINGSFPIWPVATRRFSGWRARLCASQESGNSKTKHIIRSSTLLCRPCVPWRTVASSLVRCTRRRVRQRNTRHSRYPCSIDCSCTGSRGIHTPILSEVGYLEESYWSLSRTEPLTSTLEQLEVNAHPQTVIPYIFYE